MCECDSRLTQGPARWSSPLVAPRQPARREDGDLPMEAASASLCTAMQVH